MTAPTQRRLRPRLLGAAATVALTMLVSLTATSTAVASDAFPCSSTVKDRTFSYNGRTYRNVGTQVCPLWRGSVPVHAWSSEAAPVVGRLVVGGSANWFVAQKRSNPYRLGRTHNVWWASTMADNGRWGWVSEVYFKGGGNNERDRRLLFRPTKHTCGGRCGPIPPWYR